MPPQISRERPQVTDPDLDAALPGHACQIFAGQDVFVSAGANIGDALMGPDAVSPGDIYELEAGAEALRLVLEPCAQRIAAGSEVGSAGDPVRMLARYTLMAPDGDTVDLLILDHAGALYALPLSPMAARTDYTLLKVDAAPETVRLADFLCVSFARGTMITLANGVQRPIEALEPGDRVLTRDHGAQAVRWIGHATLRAVGAFAPVVIRQGVLGNAGDLIVSQHHRMFLYQRERRVGLPTSEVLVQARHLVDGEQIFLREGGFVDYFSIVFDRHEIIYAEGVPAESLMVTEATISRLPADLAEAVQRRFPGLSQRQHFGTEAGRQVLDAMGRAALLPAAARQRG